jgi:hypothetical protein
MKNKFLESVVLIVSFFVFSLFANAQSKTIGFKSGIKIATQTEAIFNSEKQIIRPLDKWETKDGVDILHRRLVDTKNGLYTAYDIEVTRSSEPNKFNVKIKTALYQPEINKEADKAEADKDLRPNSISIESENQVLLDKLSVVKNGDIIEFEILRNNYKKYKIIDYIKVFDDKKPFAGSFSELQPTKDFTINDVYLKLMNFEVFLNGKLVTKTGGGAKGANIFFTVPERGRIFVSPFPREGYNMQKIGIIVDNKLSFTINGEKYEVICETPILSEGGNWNAWILADPNYKKSYSNPEHPDAIEMGAGNLEFFFKKSELNNLKKK